MKIKILHTHIENNLVNNAPTLVYTDQGGEEWVMSHQSLSNDGGGMSTLVKKKDCWYFDPKNKQK